jgi:hypothetical protein
MNPGNTKISLLRCALKQKAVWGPLKALVHLTLVTSGRGWIIGKQERSGATFARVVKRSECVRL